MPKYIDVDSLRFPNICIFDMTLHGETVPMVKLVDLQKLVPAADVAPVRRGRWIKDGEDGPVYCSECGEEHEWGDYRATYCDTCGAKMDGGRDDD